MFSKVYDDVTDFEVCRITKSTKIQIVENKMLFATQK